MPGERVEISYQVLVEGIQNLDNLTRKNKELEEELKRVKEKTREANEEQKRSEQSLRMQEDMTIRLLTLQGKKREALDAEIQQKRRLLEQDLAGSAEREKILKQFDMVSKAERQSLENGERHISVMGRARKAILDFRRELFALSFAVASVSGLLILLSKNSEDLGFQLQGVADSFRKLGGTLGDIASKSPFLDWIGQQINGVDALAKRLDKFLGEKGLKGPQGVPRASQIQELGLRAELAQLSGDKEKSLIIQHIAEMKKLEEIGDDDRRRRLEILSQKKFLIQRESLRKEFEIQKLGMQQNLASLRGDEESALAFRREAELLEIRKNFSVKNLAVVEEFFRQKKDLEERNLRLSELGLKNQAAIFKDFQKDLVASIKGPAGDALFNLFEGKKTNLSDFIQSVRSGLHRALADAITESAFSAMVPGEGGFGDFLTNFKDAITGRDSKAEKAMKDTQKQVERGNALAESGNKTLANIQTLSDMIRQCACATASGVSQLGNFQATIEMTQSGGGVSAPAKKSGLGGIFSSLLGLAGPLISMIPGGQILGSILGAGSGIFNLFKGGLGNLFGGGGNVSNSTVSTMSNVITGTDLENSGILAYRHSGGVVPPAIPKFEAGGEVPIMAQPGEFVVRKSVAQNNMDLLQDLNAGSRRSRGATNVFLIKANDAASFDDMLASPSAQARIEVNVIRAIMANGQIRDVIKSYAK